MIFEGKKYSSVRSKQTHTPHLEIEKAAALDLGLGKDLPLQLLSNASKTYKKHFSMRHLFGQIWAPIKIKMSLLSSWFKFL